MARKSNKTSHVLNLLAGEEPVQETPKEEEKNEKEILAESQEPAADVPDLSIITTGDSSDDSLSDLIREQLEEDFSKSNPEPPSPDSADGTGADIDIMDAMPADAPPQDSPEDRSPADGTADDAPQEDTLSQDDADDTSQADGMPQDVTDNTSHADEMPQDVTDTTSQADGMPQDVTDTTSQADDEMPQDVPDTTPQADGTSQDVTDTASQTDGTPQDVPDTTSQADGTPQDASDASDATPQASESSQDAMESGSTPETEEEPPQQDKPARTVDDLHALLYPDDEDPIHYRFVNVMEYVVKDMVLDYMHRFGMCTCERCVVDTMALTLTYCSSKYIVVDKHTVSPLLNFYANKYTGDVTVALTRACTQVNESPRH